ncbi:hypothetical protein TNCV_4234671 [Trichonephila clavipes]|nr:hypothetical protein TNCV_4234671 [Trichonephila clavipes]
MVTLKPVKQKNWVKSGHRSFSPLTLLQHVEFDPAHTFFLTCSDFWLDFAPVVRMACERKFLESEATRGFFLLLGKQGKNFMDRLAPVSNHVIPTSINNTCDLKALGSYTFVDVALVY